MSKIKILNNMLVEQGTIQSVLSSSMTEGINSDKILRFSAFLKGINQLITGTNIAEVNDDYYDIIEYKKGQNNKGIMTVDVDCEHISYRLNNPEYNLEYFTWMGTPAFILGKILEGTGFTVGTINFTNTMTYSAQEAKSRRQILMEFVALLGGEVDFNKFTVSILTQRGSSAPKDLLAGRNIEVLSKTYSKREKDSNNNPLVSYECQLINPMPISLGDVVTIDYESLDINVQLRVVILTTDPYNKYLTAFEIGNFYPSLADDAYRIETKTLAKDKIYNGTRIGPTYGFEAVRSDKKARAYFNSTNMAFQAGDGTGQNWTNKLYYDFDPDTGAATLMFDGKLSVDVITALKAQFDITISNTVITQTLAAETGTIAQLTVDQVETSTKVQNYLAGNKGDVNYIKIFEQYIQFITASTDGATTEQAKDRRGSNLYWTDDTHTGTTTDVTAYPVMIYVYTELVKAEFAFESDGTNYVPQIVLGTGDGVVGNSAKAIIKKGTTGLELNYFRSNTGELRQIRLADDGVYINGLLYELTALNIASGSFQASYGDLTKNAILTKDSTGRITAITTEDVAIPITYNEV